MRVRLAVVIGVLGGLALPSSAFAHAERASYYPNFNAATLSYGPATGAVPDIHSGGPTLVVCKADSLARVKKLPKSLRRSQLKLLRKCRYRNIQAAVDAAKNGATIKVLPGVYKENPSRVETFPEAKCKDMFTKAQEGQPVPSYDYQLNCPNSQNLIAILGDGPDADRTCDHKCNIEIAGSTGRRQDVLISGERSKLNVIRADRADGVVLRNFTIEYSDFNNIYVLETNGFRLQNIESRYSREYGLLSFASDHGLYDSIEAYNSGDSGIYPGSGPEGHCQRYGIEIRNFDSHDNTLGYSGTAGNGIWVHDSKFHNNATGIVTDSFAAGHPGMPQDCAKWESNQVYSNNNDLFNEQRDTYCKQPIAQRDPKIVCPTFQTAVGTGMMIAGGNGDITKNNYIWDNWKSGTRLFWVPAALRGDDSTGQSLNTGDQLDTSNDNSYVGNHMGVRPDGTRDPNGVDFWWDGEGKGNCWEGNVGVDGKKPISDPVNLPNCPGSPVSLPVDATKAASQVTCATWNPVDMTDPPGCDWFTRPPEPK